MAKGFMYLTAIIDCIQDLFEMERKQHNESRLEMIFCVVTKVWCA
jgi:hypothetical protein